MRTFGQNHWTWEAFGQPWTLWDKPIRSSLCLPLLPVVVSCPVFHGHTTISTVKPKTKAPQEARTVHREAREQVVTLCSLGVYYWPVSSSQIDYFIVLPWTSVARDLWLTQARQSIAVTLTLGKELCGFDLLPHRKVLTCSARGLSAEQKWAHALTSLMSALVIERLQVCVCVRESGGRPGSWRGHGLFPDWFHSIRNEMHLCLLMPWQRRYFPLVNSQQLCSSASVVGAGRTTAADPRFILRLLVNNPTFLATMSWNVKGCLTSICVSPPPSLPAKGLNVCGEGRGYFLWNPTTMNGVYIYFYTEKGI